MISAERILWSEIAEIADCWEKRAIKCYIIRPNLKDIEESSYIKIPHPGFDHVTFHRIKKWELRGTFLSEWEVISEQNYGYLTVLHNDIHVWGFFEYNGARFSIYDMSNHIDRKHKDFKVIFQWTKYDESGGQGRQYPETKYTDV